MSFLGGFLLILLLLVMFPSSTSNAGLSCHDDGTCFVLCGYDGGTTPCSYALCDDDIGTELCMSGGASPPPCEEWDPCLR